MRLHYSCTLKTMLPVVCAVFYYVAAAAAAAAVAAVVAVAAGLMQAVQSWSHTPSNHAIKVTIMFLFIYNPQVILSSD